MKVLSNPWTKFEAYNCFGCSSGNPAGLKMVFAEEGDCIICEWEPESHFQGYFDTLHGGIQATLMDEIASWTVFVKADKGGVTSRMEIKFRRPVKISDGKIKLVSRLQEINQRIARIKVELFNQKNQLCAEAMVDYFILSRGNHDDDDIMFPGKDAFYQ